MAELKISSRYAKSVADLAIEMNQLESVHNDMLSFYQSAESSLELQQLLKNPIVNSDSKLKILNAIFGSSFNKLTMSFFELITKKRRENLLMDVAIAFHKLYNTKNGIIEASVESATDLGKDILDKIQGIIESQVGLKVEMQVTVNPKLISGFIVKVGDKQIDTSIANKLHDIKKQFSGNPYLKNY
jgi:F-type H+-transporting ATPase subunit delta